MANLESLSLAIEGVSLIEFFGVNNQKFTLLKRAFPRLKINSRGSKISAEGNANDLKQFEEVVHNTLTFLRTYGRISIENLEAMLDGVEPNPNADVTINSDVILYGTNGRAVRARTPNQKELVNMVEGNDIVFAIGPAGTGKTYTAVALAVRALKNKVVRKIILTRPAVEAGESLGFLPGDLKEKIDPYLRPLYDALEDMIPTDKLKYFFDNRVIEIAPLAYMRGRTLNNAYIILDEAQNTNELQLKMFLTRIGPTAKCIITGDMTQVDLPKNQRSGLVKALDILGGIKGIGILRLTTEDVMRHKLVKQIIKAYDNDSGAGKRKAGFQTNGKAETVKVEAEKSDKEGE